jgi:hypothetical protein
MRTPCTSICFGGKDGILTKSAFNMWNFMLLWINILYYNHSCRKMLNDIANMTLSYRNMVLYVCDRIGSIVHSCYCLCLCILLFSSPTALIMPLQRASILISVYLLQTIPLSSNHMILSSLGLDNLTTYTYLFWDIVYHITLLCFCYQEFC